MNSPMESAPFLSFHISLLFHKKLDKILLEEHGIDWMTGFILIALENFGYSSLVELSHYIGHSHPSVLRRLDAVEKEGFVQRTPDPDDRRVKQIHLTQKGKDLLPHLMRIKDEIHTAAVKGIPEAELMNIVDGLKTIFDNLRDGENIPIPHNFMNKEEK
jgi:MarR family transcriptional regulator, transcriptional regulator for hemolysin